MYSLNSRRNVLNLMVDQAYTNAILCVQINRSSTQTKHIRHSQSRLLFYYIHTLLWLLHYSCLWALPSQSQSASPLNITPTLPVETRRIDALFTCALQQMLFSKMKICQETKTKTFLNGEIELAIMYRTFKTDLA